MRKSLQRGRGLRSLLRRDTAAHKPAVAAAPQRRYVAVINHGRSQPANTRLTTTTNDNELQQLAKLVGSQRLNHVNILLEEEMDGEWLPLGCIKQLLRDDILLRSRATGQSANYVQLLHTLVHRLGETPPGPYIHQEIMEDGRVRVGVGERLITKQLAIHEQPGPKMTFDPVDHNTELMEYIATLNVNLRQQQQEIEAGYAEKRAQAIDRQMWQQQQEQEAQERRRQAQGTLSAINDSLAKP